MSFMQKMIQPQQHLNGFKQGIAAGIPVVIGYFPVAMAFGILSKTVEISLMDSFLFSLLVFAGASQFMALDLIKAGMMNGSIILTTFLLNLRHLMMSASLAARISEIRKKWLFFIAFGVTDETFAIASVKGDRLGASYLLTLHGVSYLSWVSGTIAGYLVGTVLPVAVQNSLGIGLYAMFIAILVPEIQKSIQVLLLAVISGIIYMLIGFFELVPSEWSLITAIILASTAGVLIFPDHDREEIK